MPTRNDLTECLGGQHVCPNCGDEMHIIIRRTISARQSQSASWYGPFVDWRDTVAYALGYDIFEDSWAYTDEDEQLKIVLRLIDRHRRIESLSEELLDISRVALAYLTDHAIDLDGDAEQLLASIRLRLDDAIQSFE